MGSITSSAEITGTCLCRNITIKITNPQIFDQPQAGHVCHCLNCRKYSATGVGLMALPSADVVVSDPHSSIKTYRDKQTDSGNTVPRSFCSNCGSTIGALPIDSLPQLSMIATGLFPNPPRPEFETYTKDRLEWVSRVANKEDQCERADEFPRYIGKYLQ